MKRVLSACICQTLHFMPKEFNSHAARFVRAEIEQYKKTLESHSTLYKIVEETEQPDGSVIVKVIKQYNYSPVGDYMD